MIQKIHIENVATYRDGQDMVDCKTVNLVYGANGSGKSTLCGFLNSPDDNRYKLCKLIADSDDDILVYNRDFKEKNFRLNQSFPGVFTLGKDSIDKQNELQSLKTKLEWLEEEGKKLQVQINEKITELGNADNVFQEKLWTNLFHKYESELSNLLSGFKRKALFKEKIVNTYKILKQGKLFETATLSIDEIINQSKEINGQQINIWEGLYFDFSRESVEASQIIADDIWGQSIVGTENLPISGLISKLQNSDWVNQGRKYVSKGSDICPFCQRHTLTEELKEEIESYFSGEYQKSLETIQSLEVKWARLASVFKEKSENLLWEKDLLAKVKVDVGMLSNLIQSIENIFRQGDMEIQLKLREPARKVQLPSFHTSFEDLNKLILNGNQVIDTHNKIINNIEKTRQDLMQQMWLTFVREQKLFIESELKKENNLTKGINGLKAKSESTSKAIVETKRDIKAITATMTNITSAIDSMNTSLQAYGFLSFKIAKSEKVKDSYCIVREDGTSANRTLSEGEETFISFLYFMQLVNCNSKPGEDVKKKVIVLDDPISSLDNTILFIVSVIVKDLMSRILEKKSDAVQLFVFTHNIYFHKEISNFLNNNNSALKESHFWIIQKNDRTTKIKDFFQTNPIKSSYELLWEEYRNSKDSTAVSLQNCMRRILDNYFSILGKHTDIKKEVLKKMGTIEEKQICESLFSWMNDGSHSINDDLYVDINDATISRFKNVFKKIFQVSGQIAHYNMMMKIESDSSDCNDDGKIDAKPEMI